MNKFISLSEDIHLKLSHFLLKRLIEKERILRKQLISEKIRNSEFIIDKLYLINTMCNVSEILI